jgi:hypothetical protein
MEEATGNFARVDIVGGKNLTAEVPGADPMQGTGKNDFGTYGSDSWTVNPRNVTTAPHPHAPGPAKSRTYSLWAIATTGDIFFEPVATYVGAVGFGMAKLYNTISGNVSAIDGGFPSSGVWAHILVSVNHVAKTVSLRTNGGAPTTSSALSGTIATATDFWRFILNQGDAGVDEFGIWNRVLTSTEGDDLYNAGAGLFY